MNNNDYFYLIINKSFNFIMGVIVLIVIWLIPLECYSFLILFNPHYLNIYLLSTIILIQGMCLVILIFQIRRYFSDNYPVFLLTFLINKERIEIKIRNQIYFIQFWANIKKIEIIQESYYFPFTDPYKMEFFSSENSREIRYKIKFFFTSDDYKEIRLFSLKIKGNNVKRIINVIDKVTKEYQLQVEKKQENASIYQKYLKD